MIDATRIATELREWVGEELLHGRDEGLDGATPLLEWGVLDSLSLGQLVEFVHARFGVTVPPDEVVPDNFETLDAVTALVVRLRSGVEEGVV